MKVYIDNVLIKSNEAALHIDDLAEAFDALRRHQMKLNLTKCTFDTTSNFFFDFMVTRRGIEANPEKIRMILDMKPPTS